MLHPKIQHTGSLQGICLCQWNDFFLTFYTFYDGIFPWKQIDTMDIRFIEGMKQVCPAYTFCYIYSQIIVKAPIAINFSVK
jgi:hypothetical protein